MKQYFLNIIERPKEVAKGLQYNFNSKKGKEKWLYLLRAYSLYMGFMVFVFGSMRGTVVAYAFLIYGVVSFVALSFFISVGFARNIDTGDNERLALRNIVFYMCIVFLPAAFVLSGMTGIAVSFFSFVFAGVVFYYYIITKEEELKNIKRKIYATAKTAYNASKTKKSREQGGFPYAVYEVSDSADGIQER